jgi:hypothetical protein
MHESPSTTSTTIPATIATHLFSVLCIYRFCAPCVCNAHNTSTYSHCIDILHNSSALSDHHRDSSTSLAVFPLVRHHCMLCCDSSVSLAVETLRLLCDSRAHLLCSSYKLQCSSSYQSPPRASSSLLKIPRDSSSPLSITPKCLRVLWQKPSVVSGSYTVTCNSSPSIMLRSTCIIGFTLMGSCVMYPFRAFAIRRFCNETS